MNTDTVQKQKKPSDYIYYHRLDGYFECRLCMPRPRFTIALDEVDVMGGTGEGLARFAKAKSLMVVHVREQHADILHVHSTP